MPSADGPPERSVALATALQWGLVQTFALDTLGRLLRNYYRATTAEFFPPGWVTSIQFAAPLGLLVGGVGGYRWATSGRAAASASTHRNRVVFVGALLVGWVLAIVPTAAFGWLFDEGLFSVPYFLLPTAAAVSALAGAYVLAYRVDPEWYDNRRTRLLGAVAGSLVGLLLATIGFTAYGEYLAATRTDYSFDGGRGLVLAASLGAVVGAVSTDTDRAADRSAEFVFLVIPSLLAFRLVTAVAALGLGAVGGPTRGVASSVLVPPAPTALALGVAGYLAYGAETSLHARLVGRR